MTRPPIDTSQYDNVVLIDTQVVLEAKPLDQLPWADLFPGRTLLLVCRQVQSEIDAKKNDGRLGKRSRQFSKLMDGFIETQTPVAVVADPQVDVALVRSRRPDWGALDDLDADDGDDRIVAQALNAIVDDPSRITVLSHDMRPRDAALAHGLRAVKLPETWLREPEPSPEERRVTDLEGRVRLLSANQPEIRVRIATDTPAPWQIRVVGPPTGEQSEAIISARLATAPAVSARDPFGGFSYDSTHRDRLATWRKLLRRDIPLLGQGLTRMFAQHRIKVTIENIGTVSAENLSLEIRSGNAILHAIPYRVLVLGMSAPRERGSFHLPHLQTGGLIQPRREQFSFYWDEQGPGGHVIISCGSFRQEKSFEIEVSVEVPASAAPKVNLEAVVTASNMKGDARDRLMVDAESVAADLRDVFDTQTMRLRADAPYEGPMGPDAEETNWFLNDGSKVDDWD